MKRIECKATLFYCYLYSLLFTIFELIFKYKITHNKKHKMKKFIVAIIGIVLLSVLSVFVFFAEGTLSSEIITKFPAFENGKEIKDQDYHSIEEYKSKNEVKLVRKGQFDMKLSQANKLESSNSKMLMEHRATLYTFLHSGRDEEFYTEDDYLRNVAENGEKMMKNGEEMKYILGIRMDNARFIRNGIESVFRSVDIDVRINRINFFSQEEIQWPLAIDVRDAKSGQVNSNWSSTCNMSMNSLFYKTGHLGARGFTDINIETGMLYFYEKEIKFPTKEYIEFEGKFYFIELDYSTEIIE